MMRIVLALITVLMIGLAPETARAAEPAKKKIVFVVGRQSHGWTGHAYAADCALLGNILTQNVPGIETTVIKGWPKDLSVFDGAAAIVIGCDGNGLVGSKANWEALEAITAKGVGIGFIHYSLDPGKDAGQFIYRMIGGYYEQHWSVNPHWLADFKSLPDHPITRGVKPFKLADEWYYHMRFQPELKGVKPILSAVPPDSTRERKDGPHSGNPTVRSRKGLAEHVMWAYERPDGGRGFGTTGGHTHWSYANDNYRKTLLNAILWIAKIEVPADGVPSKRPTVEEMEANLEGAPPKGWTADKSKEAIEKANQ